MNISKPKKLEPKKKEYKSTAAYEDLAEAVRKLEPGQGLEIRPDQPYATKELHRRHRRNIWIGLRRQDIGFKVASFCTEEGVGIRREVEAQPKAKRRKKATKKKSAKRRKA